MVVSRDNTLLCLQAISSTLKANRDYLTELDAAIGDADHGINMDRGFTAVMARLPSVQEEDIGTILKTVGMALVSTVGGAAGPLYGTFFLRMGKSAENRFELTGGDLEAAFAAGVQGVMERGKAKLGDKTMVDALQPAASALHSGLAAGTPAPTALAAAVAAAEAGMKATIPMLALRGRASYLGERSIGHQDPGATSAYLMLKAAVDCLEGSS
jgi:dihydroxyacetone kinase-like protein